MKHPFKSRIKSLLCLFIILQKVPHCKNGWGTIETLNIHWQLNATFACLPKFSNFIFRI